MAKNRTTAPGAWRRGTVPLPSVQVAYIFALREELHHAARVLRVAIPKRVGDLQRTSERNALARLLRFARIGRDREQVHNRDRVADRAQHSAQLAEQAAIIERLDVGGEIRASWPRMTIVGEIPEGFESHPQFASFARLFGERKAALDAADRVAADTRSGRGTRLGAKATGLGRSASTKARDSQIYAAFLKRFQGGIVPSKGSHHRRPAILAIARQFGVGERTARDAIAKSERKLAV